VRRLPPRRRIARAWPGVAAFVLALGAWAPSPSRAESDAAIEAHLQRSVLSVGESTPLEIMVRGTVSGDPEFDLPAGLEILGSGRVQNFSWVNGKGSTQVVFRYELGAQQAGHFTLGPFRVRVGNAVATAPAIDVTVNAGGPSIGGSAKGPATLIADVEPREPYVGQPVVLRVRLVQRSQLAEDPQYVPPATPGFWSEPASRPESYYAAQGNERVLVTETRTRLYPLATGTQTIGEAVAHVALFEAGTNDPSLWFGGQVPRREMLLRSPRLAVQVKPLPVGAPVGFDGAVGVLTATWNSDRDRTARDVPVTVRLDLRGIGNLPLVHAPKLESDDFEIFSLPVEDSLGAPGQAAAGRRSFAWTVLPRHEGTLSVHAPALVWFDPAAHDYRAADLAPVTLEVGPAINAAGDVAQAFPLVFAEHPLAPGGPRALPWLAALGGLLAGGALALDRRANRARLSGPASSGPDSRLASLSRAHGADFWALAEEATQWLAERSVPVSAIRDQIASARYGGGSADAAAVRRALIDRLTAQRERPRSPWPVRLIAGSLALAGLTLAILGMGFGDGPSSGARASLAADAAARAGRLAEAKSQWLALWKDGARDAGLAARLGWAEIRGGEVGPAAAWVLAGELDEPRDAASDWVRARVAEAGGLTGAGSGRLPVRRPEWALAGFVLAAIAPIIGWRLPATRRTRSLAAAIAVLAVAAAVMFPLQTLVLLREDRAVIRVPTHLEGSEIELESGQVVRILSIERSRAHILAGRGVAGWVPAGALYRIGELIP
jgi:hypothetical protein